MMGVEAGADVRMTGFEWWCCGWDSFIAGGTYRKVQVRRGCFVWSSSYYVVPLDSGFRTSATLPYKVIN